MVGVLVVAAFLLALTLRPRGDDAFEGAVIETGPGQEQTLQLADGSRLLLGASTRLHLVNLGRRQVQLELERGALDANVTHVAGRRFVVSAGALHVDVVGTRFRVTLDPSGVQARVSVTQGRVHLTSTDGRWPEVYVSAGESWSSPSAREELGTGDLDAGAVDAPDESAAPPVHGAPAVHRPPLAPAFTSLYKQGRYVEAYDSLGPSGFSDAVARAAPQELMMLAETARLARHTTDAALAFDTLRSRYPNDTRSALASMELGRLRLNELDDPRGAADAFEDATRLDPEGPLREDAEARRVEALERSGDHDACRSARDAYLRSYPQGVHTASVARMCR